MAIVGAIALTLVAIFLLTWVVGIPYLGLGFGGPTTENLVIMFVGLIAGAIVVWGWWALVGTHISVSFG